MVDGGMGTVRTETTTADMDLLGKQKLIILTQTE